VALSGVVVRLSVVVLNHQRTVTLKPDPYRHASTLSLRTEKRRRNTRTGFRLSFLETQLSVVVRPAATAVESRKQSPVGQRFERA
jgi:hypothetical protein